MQKFFIFILVLFATCIFFTSTTYATNITTTEFQQSSQQGFSSEMELTIVQATVIEILDTDVIRVQVNGKSIDVHLSGLSSPTDIQLRNYFNQNKEKIRDTIESLLLHNTIFLVSTYDQNTIELEPWERYVFLKDMTFVNEIFLKQGLAIANSTSEINLKYRDEFKAFQQQAQQEKKGIWHIDLPTPIKKVIPISSIPPTASPPIIYSTPSPTLTPTAQPTRIPTQTPSPTASVLSSSAQNFPVNSLSAEKIFDLINDHRKSKNLPALEKNDYLCQIAKTRAPQLYDEIFTNHNVHAGFYAMNLPYWITENMAHYESEGQVVSWWLNSTVHRQAIEGTHTSTCGACYGKSCVQLFTSFIKK